MEKNKWILEIIGNNIKTARILKVINKYHFCIYKNSENLI